MSHTVRGDRHVPATGGGTDGRVTVGDPLSAVTTMMIRRDRSYAEADRPDRQSDPRSRSDRGCVWDAADQKVNHERVSRRRPVAPYAGRAQLQPLHRANCDQS